MVVMPAMRVAVLSWSTKLTVQYSAVVIVSERGGKDLVPSFVMLDIAQDPFMATVYRTALIVALEDFLVACRFSATS
jgi:hypothetical protein